MEYAAPVILPSALATIIIIFIIVIQNIPANRGFFLYIYNFVHENKRLLTYRTKENKRDATHFHCGRRQALVYPCFYRCEHG